MIAKFPSSLAALAKACMPKNVFIDEKSIPLYHPSVTKFEVEGSTFTITAKVSTTQKSRPVNKKFIVSEGIYYLTQVAYGLCDSVSTLPKVAMIQEVFKNCHLKVPPLEFFEKFDIQYAELRFTRDYHLALSYLVKTYRHLDFCRDFINAYIGRLLAYPMLNNSLMVYLYLARCNKFSSIINALKFVSEKFPEERKTAYRFRLSIARQCPDDENRESLFRSLIEMYPEPEYQISIHFARRDHELLFSFLDLEEYQPFKEKICRYLILLYGKMGKSKKNLHDLLKLITPNTRDYLIASLVINIFYRQHRQIVDGYELLQTQKFGLEYTMYSVASIYFVDRRRDLTVLVNSATHHYEIYHRKQCSLTCFILRVTILRNQTRYREATKCIKKNIYRAVTEKNRIGIMCILADLYKFLGKYHKMIQIREEIREVASKYPEYINILNNLSADIMSDNRTSTKRTCREECQLVIPRVVRPRV